ncbi:hypothetical protein [Nocardioides sp. KR10-350]|uniref:hypothetical protein n=1 Tax=Nocardioides cheoyonin TaxID=3156615 RepID=UPI0032B45799
MDDTTEHWWHRLAEDVKRWLEENPGAPLSDRVFDAVIGAGGVPLRHEPGGEGLPDAPRLSDEDWEYCKEARRRERGN